MTNVHWILTQRNKNKKDLCEHLEHFGIIRFFFKSTAGLIYRAGG